MRKSAFCIYENKDTILLLPNSEISNLWSCSVCVQPGLCWVLVGNPEDRFCHDSAHLSAMFSVHLACIKRHDVGP